MENNKEVKLARLHRMEGTVLSENAYNGVIGLTLLLGIVINVIMAAFLKSYILQIDPRAVLVLYFVLSLGGMFIVYRSSSPVISLLGFCALAIGMGLLLTFYVSLYTAGTVYTAFIATGIVVVAMMLLSLFFPAFFLSLGRVLVFALLGSVVIELICGLLLHMPLTFMDYIIVIIFAGYVGYDWARAQEYPKTLDNAIDSAADIYVDIVNIFVRILSILGKKND